jgi:hypothetical protein
MSIILPACDDVSVGQPRPCGIRQRTAEKAVGGVQMARRSLAAVIVFALFVCPAAWGAGSRSDAFLKAIQSSSGEPMSDVARPAPEHVRADTICWGGTDGYGYAVEGGIWDFDDGTMQGWYAIDLTANDPNDPWFGRVTANDFECPDQQIWIGKQQSYADVACWACDAGLTCSLGYENDLCQRIESPVLAYGQGDVVVTFDYFSDCEGEPYDYVDVLVVALDTQMEELDALLAGRVGGAVGSPTAPELFSGTVFSSDIPSGTAYVRVRFQFVSDPGWSDEDGEYCSTYGPFGADNVTVSIDGAVVASYDFDTGDDGWTAGVCPGVGTFAGVQPASNYDLPPGCSLSGYVLEFHDDQFQHPGDPDGQHEIAVSPIVDRTAYPAPDYNVVLARWDMYFWQQGMNGVLYRPGWFYYPYECPQSGEMTWSRRVGQGVWYYGGSPGYCISTSNVATENGVPPDADLYRFALEVLCCCSCIGFCDDVPNATPLFDNIQVCLTGIPNAPVIEISGNGACRYQDGFAQSNYLEPAAPGRSDVWLNLNWPDASTCVLGDSLCVEGPPEGGWEARLWFRVARKGPVIDDYAYEAWKSRFAGDPDVEFVGVLMDSVETAVPWSYRFASYFHEEDPGFDPAYADLSDGNEILPDNLFTPGTKIEYFVTANWVDSPGDYYYLPDTTGGTFMEYEILPSMRVDPVSEQIVWPCLLYVDAYNRGAERFIAPALDAYLPDVPGEGPDFDKYDELGYSSNMNCSFCRTLGGNNGATLLHLLGYRAILYNTGNFGPGAGEPGDIQCLEYWLSTSVCDGNVNRQGLILNGDQIVGIVDAIRPSFLTSYLGAYFVCEPYGAADCPAGTPEDTSACVQVIEPAGAAYPPMVNLYAIENYGTAPYTVVGTTGGIGNRSWFDYDFSGPKGQVDFAEVVSDNSGSEWNYRSVIDGYSYHHLTSSFYGTMCIPDSAGIVTAAGQEIAAALDWVFDGNPPSFCVLCNEEPGDVGEVDVRVNRLFQNRPNPFNPRTVIRFSLAQRGDVELAIYDASGRLVRKLVDGRLEPGLHEAVWDGLDERGQRVSSGIYWSQLRTEGYVSSKKLVVLR